MEEKKKFFYINYREVLSQDDIRVNIYDREYFQKGVTVIPEIKKTFLHLIDKNDPLKRLFAIMEEKLANPQEYKLWYGKR